MREQVITSRGPRSAANAPKPRASGMVQRPAAKRTRAASASARADASSLKTALRYVPAAAKLLLAVCVGVAFFYGYLAVASASFFQVGNVDVEGTKRVSRDDVKETVLRVAGSAGVWRADLAAVDRELRELPWVRSAIVSRVLPSGIRVRIKEREPRLIARTSGGRLVWVDDEGVMLGTASAGDSDLIIRGLDEARSDSARRRNRERMAAALALADEWEKTGLARRVSEVNLEEIKDVRVQLAGADAQVEVRLGTEDFVKRFSQALEVLDESRQTRRTCVNYIDMTQSKSRRAIVGPGPCARAPVENAAGVEPENPEPESVKSSEAVAPRGVLPAGGSTVKVVKKAVAKNENERRKNVRQEKERAKKEDAAKQTGGAVRPRRVG